LERVAVTPNADLGAPLRVLSLGAGVQSSTVLLMSLAGELPPLDLVIFADTQAEPASVYKHLWWLAGRCADGGLPLHVVTNGSLTNAALDLGARSGTIPVFLRSPAGNQGTVRRDCTSDFKVVVIERELRRVRSGRPVEEWFGISLDEVGRMRDASKPWIVNRYPLVEHRMTRWDCERWLAARGLTAPRSACSYCPYHSNNEWRRLRDEEPVEFAKAVEFERNLQAAHRDWAGKPTKRFRGVPYLHRSMVPLDQADIRSEEEQGQGSLFGEECAGVCGV
jgi:hypothetical protein